MYVTELWEWRLPWTPEILVYRGSIAEGTEGEWEVSTMSSYSCFLQSVIR